MEIKHSTVWFPLDIIFWGWHFQFFFSHSIFQALGNLYFIHQNVQDVQIWDFEGMPKSLYYVDREPGKRKVFFFIFFVYLLLKGKLSRHFCCHWISFTFSCIVLYMYFYPLIPLSRCSSKTFVFVLKWTLGVLSLTQKRLLIKVILMVFRTMGNLGQDFFSF